MLPLDEPLLLQYMLSLGISVCLFYSTAVCTVPRGVSPVAACASSGRICSTAACAVPGWPTGACGASVQESQCCTETCLQELLCAFEVSVGYIESVLHYACLSVRAAPGSVCLQ